MKSDADFVTEHVRYTDARIRQIKSVHSLIDERIAIAAKIADIDNVLIEIQRSREHERWQTEQKRNAEKIHQAYDNQIAVARKEMQLAQAREALVRAQRNCEAAERLKDVEVDRWYAEAEARRTNALAERQDAAADLARGPLTAADPATVAAVAQKQREHDLAALDHEIELQRGRGDQHAVLALMNAKARLRAT